MKCDRCGKEIPDTDLYCGRCGKAVFPEYMDEDDRWAYYKTDEELEEILKAEQGEEKAEPTKPVQMTNVPKEEEKIIQTEEEPEQEKPEVEKTTEAEEKEDTSVTEPEETPKLNEEPQEEPQMECQEVEPAVAEEEEKPPLSPEKKKKRRNIAILITFLLLLCLGIGIALGMKRMKDLDRQEKEYYEKLHKEVVHQDTPSEEIEKEVDETEKQDAAQEETTKQERFQLVNPDEIDFSQYQKIVPVSTEQNSIKESDTYDYSAQSAVDGDSSTSWQENEENTGETTGIRINFDGNHKVRYLVLYLGNWRSDQLWEYSARPKTLTIQVGDSETKDIEFSDEKKKFCLSFEEPIDASYISMYIADSYEGSRWNDNGISEVEIYE